MFSLEQLLFSVASDVRTNTETLESILPMLEEVYERGKKERDEIKVKFAIQLLLIQFFFDFLFFANYYWFFFLCKSVAWC